MKLRRILHHLLITIGLTIGVITTGTTINAKAQQLNTNNININKSNNEPNNQNIDNYKINNPSSTLVNIPKQNIKNNNYYNTNSYKNINNSLNKYKSNYNANLRPSKNYSEVNNYKNNHVTLKVINNKSNNLYQRIILNTTKMSSNLKKTSRTNTSHFIKYNNNINPHNIYKSMMRLSGLSGYNHYKHINRHHRNRNWFRDGLSKRNFKARNWISWHESNDRWRVLSYGKVCVGYFQLNPSYLGYIHGHVNLNKKHQVRVADSYVHHRYGNWLNAKRFWEIHHWY